MDSKLTLSQEEHTYLDQYAQAHCFHHAFQSCCCERNYAGFLDFTPTENFKRHTIYGATSLTLPFAERMAELPEKSILVTRKKDIDIPNATLISNLESFLALVSDSSQQESLVEGLASRGYRIVHVFVQTDIFYRECEKRNLLSFDVISRQLWKPSPLLSNYVEVIEKRIVTDHPRALDIGCGIGRDCSFLAERGWHVWGFDSLQKIISKADQFLRRTTLNYSNVKLEKKAITYDNIPSLIRDLQPHLVIMARFMEKRLLDPLWRALPVGSCLLIHAFALGAEKWNRPATTTHLLSPSDLPKLLYTKATFSWQYSVEVLVNEELNIPDGRPIRNFLALRKEPNEN